MSVVYNSPQKGDKKWATKRYDKTNSHIFTTAAHLHTHTHTNVHANTHAQPHTDMTHVTDAHTHAHTDRLPKISATWLLRPRQRRHRRLYRLIVSHIDRDGAESARHLRYNTPTPHPPRPTVYQSPVTLIPTVPAVRCAGQQNSARAAGVAWGLIFNERQRTEAL